MQSRARRQGIFRLPSPVDRPRGLLLIPEPYPSLTRSGIACSAAIGGPLQRANLAVQGGVVVTSNQPAPIDGQQLLSLTLNMGGHGGLQKVTRSSIGNDGVPPIFYGYTVISGPGSGATQYASNPGDQTLTLDIGDGRFDQLYTVPTVTSGPGGVGYIQAASETDYQGNLLHASVHNDSLALSNSPERLLLCRLQNADGSVDYSRKYNPTDNGDGTLTYKVANVQRTTFQDDSGNIISFTVTNNTVSFTPIPATLIQHQLTAGMFITVTKPVGGLNANDGDQFYLINYSEDGSHTTGSFQLSTTLGGSAAALGSGSCFLKAQQVGLLYKHSRGQRPCQLTGGVAMESSQISPQSGDFGNKPVGLNGQTNNTYLIDCCDIGYSHSPSGAGGAGGTIDDSFGSRVTNSTLAWGGDVLHPNGDFFVIDSVLGPAMLPTAAPGNHSDIVQNVGSTRNITDGDVWLDVAHAKGCNFASLQPWTAGESNVPAGAARWVVTYNANGNNTTNYPITLLRRRSVGSCGSQFDSNEMLAWEIDGIYKQSWLPSTNGNPVTYRTGDMRIVEDPTQDWPQLIICNTSHTAATSYTSAEAVNWTVDSSTDRLLHLAGTTWLGFINTTDLGYSVFGNQADYLDTYTGAHAARFEPSNTANVSLVQSVLDWGGYADGNRNAFLLDSTSINSDNFTPGQNAQDWPQNRGQGGVKGYILGGKKAYKTVRSASSIIIAYVAQQANQYDSQITTTNGIDDGTTIIIDSGSAQETVTTIGDPDVSQDNFGNILYTSALTSDLVKPHNVGAVINVAGNPNAGTLVPNLSGALIPGGSNAPIIQTTNYNYLLTNTYPSGATIINVTSQGFQSPGDSGQPNPNAGLPWSPVPNPDDVLTPTTNGEPLTVQSAVTESDGSYTVTLQNPTTKQHGSGAIINSSLSTWIEVPFSKLRDYDMTWMDIINHNYLGLFVSSPDGHRFSFADATRVVYSNAWSSWPTVDQTAGNWSHLAYRAAAGTNVITTFEALTPNPTLTLYLGAGNYQETIRVISSAPLLSGGVQQMAPDGSPLFKTTLSSALLQAYPARSPISTIPHTP